jgi:hypothetical protein
MDNVSGVSRETADAGTILRSREAELIKNQHARQILLWISAVLLLLLNPVMVWATSYVYVGNVGTSLGDGGGISVIGTTSHTLVASLPGNVVTTFTPDGAFGFTFGSSIVAGAESFIFDARTNEILGPSPVFNAVFSSDGSRTYLSNNGLSISVLNNATGNLIATIQVPNSFIFPITVTPDGNFLYVAGHETASSKTSQVFVVSTSTNVVVDTIPVPSDKSLGKIAFSPNGDRAYFEMNQVPPQAGPTQQQIEVIEVSTSDVVNTLTIPDAQGGGIIDMEISRDGSILYLSLADGLYFLNVATNSVVGFMPIDASLFGVSLPGYSVKLRGTAITPNGAQIYLSASLHLRDSDPIGSRLFIIDLERRTIVDSLNFSDSVHAPGAWGDPTIGPDRACGEDFTTQTVVAKSGFSQYIFPQLQLQYVTVINLRSQPIRGPITLFLTNLNNGIFVGNNLRSTCYSAAGTSYTVVSAGPDNIFSPGEVVIVPLLFFKTGTGPITYSQRVVSSSPGQ